MITTLAVNKMRQVKADRNALCISIYLTTLPGFKNIETNRILFKNAVKTASNMSKDPFMPASLSRDKSWEQHADELLHDMALWKSLSHGLAVLIDHKGAKAYKSGNTFEPRVFVGLHFVKQPLYSELTKIPDTSYALALSQKATRLISLTNGEAQEIAEDKIPRSLQETLNLDEASKELQSHTVGSAGTKNSEAFHGHAYQKDHKKIHISMFMRLVARQVKGMLAGSNDPLYVIGTKSLVSQFHKHNSYKFTICSDIYGSFDHMDAPQIQKLLLTTQKGHQV